ncbi:MAG: ornithine cyclodeaminase family protein, partial [Alphaproteobacteria bacterium]|nr:ornithine cyclodeaminase family protein [Alphaproteobacteria bacterium]
RGLASGNGLMLLFDQETGVPTDVLLDEGHLTDVRTAVAGAIGARHLAPRDGGPVGILGTGMQARLQLRHLRGIVPFDRAVVWGRDAAKVARYRDDMSAEGFRVEAAASPADLAARCRLIVTTTPATAPLLLAADIRPGTHINAMGSDTPHKQELDAAILGRADRVVADSRAQAQLRGEIHKAIASGVLDMARVAEIGEVIAGRAPGRTRTDQITVFDSTGVAVQDIKIASAVAARLAQSLR